jgi:hypothetical protein
MNEIGKIQWDIEGCVIQDSSLEICGAEAKVF